MTENNELLLFELLKNSINEEVDHYEYTTIEMLSIENTLTEYFFTDSFLDEYGRISLAYENLKHIPRQIADRFGSQIQNLDLSYNNFRDFSFLSTFVRLHTLILDRNENPDESTIPFLPNLEILWLNNCKIKNISKWIYKIQRQCPHIRYLSLLGNPGARTLFSGASATEETEYRNFVVNALPTLVYLDDKIVSRNPTKNIIKNSKPLNSFRLRKKKEIVLNRKVLESMDTDQNSSTS